jgi:hypothetical protein
MSRFYLLHLTNKVCWALTYYTGGVCLLSRTQAGEQGKLQLEGSGAVVGMGVTGWNMHQSW